MNTEEYICKLREEYISKLRAEIKELRDVVDELLPMLEYVKLMPSILNIDKVAIKKARKLLENNIK